MIIAGICDLLLLELLRHPSLPRRRNRILWQSQKMGDAVGEFSLKKTVEYLLIREMLFVETKIFGENADLI